MAVFFVALIFGLWSLIFPLGKLAVEHASFLFVTAVRMLLAGTLLIGYLALRRKLQWKEAAKQWLPLSLLAFFSIYLTNILELWGLRYLSAAKTCFIYSLSPLFTALLSYIHFSERINRKKALGLSIGFLGMIPVFMAQTGCEELLQISQFLSWPTLAVIGAVFCSVYGWILLRRITLQKGELSPVAANGWSMLLGGFFALAHSVFFESWSPLPMETGHANTTFYYICWMILISNVLCYNLYGFMLKRFTATFLSFIGLLSPVFASLTSWLLLGETPSWLILLSTAIVLLGLWLVYTAELKTKKAIIPTADLSR
jgi:drug/metabolite transporter (DMT)-like permease